MGEQIADNLIQQIRGGLLIWYDFCEAAKILYVGSKDDVYLEGIHDRDFAISTIAPQDVTTSWAQEHHREYDYAICISHLEAAEDPVALLLHLHEAIHASGHVLLGMNNRLGIKYFCGDRDPYTNRTFDGVEGYLHYELGKDKQYCGRCYSRSEIQAMIKSAGFAQEQFFSVASDIENPVFIFAEDYVPNEDLSTRIFPTYNHPQSVFLEEESLYPTLVKEDLLHKLCNGFFIDCTDCGSFSDILHVTSSMERGKENSLLTIIRRGGIVEKRAAYKEGLSRLEQIALHDKELRERGIKVVESKLENGSYIMPFMNYPVGQLYLKELLHTDMEQFLKEMDHFRDILFQSSEIIAPDTGDGNGATLKKAYFDMVPLNSFYVDGDFVFYDQEFCEENYPANVMLWRLVASFYFGDPEVEKILPMDFLLERYGIKQNLSKWQQMEWGRLGDIKQVKELWQYHQDCYRKMDVLKENREALNYASRDYIHYFVDIYKNADTKKLLLFGAGAYAKHFISCNYFDYPVDAIIDNNEEKWGEQLEGIPIVSPSYLADIPKDSYKVIICMKNFKTVMRQLDALGVVDYSVYEKGKTYPKPSAKRSIADSSEAKKYHVGYVAGAFDMFHMGHVNLLRKAKEQCDYLIVGVLSDEGIYQLKQKYPIIPCEDRVEVIRACKYADRVEALPANQMSIEAAYERFHFDAQFSGDDHANNANWLASREYLRARGSDIVFFDYTKKVSSTMLREQINK